jgi:hypothetical protein
LFEPIDKFAAGVGRHAVVNVRRYGTSGRQRQQTRRLSRLNVKPLKLGFLAAPIRARSSQRTDLIGTGPATGCRGNGAAAGTHNCIVSCAYPAFGMRRRRALMKNSSGLIPVAFHDVELW